MFKKAKKNKKGFTLAELLIVVAIIAVLVAISIPIFTTQLEKSKEAVDLANIRTAYAEVMTAAVSEDKSTETKIWDSSTNAYTKTIDLTQSKDGWTTDVSNVKIGEISIKDSAPKASGQCTVSYTPGATAADAGTVTVDFSK